MKEQIVVGEIEVEGVELIDLGDAAMETRQWHPSQVILDNPFTYGRPFSA